MQLPESVTPPEADDAEMTASPVQRLCSEIKLFDLCELDDCSYREGRFCNDRRMLESFEKIADVEQRVPDGFDESDFDEDEDDLSGYDDEYDDGDDDE